MRKVIANDDMTDYIGIYPDEYIGHSPEPGCSRQPQTKEWMLISLGLCAAITGMVNRQR
jgi:hypothetical protein